MNAFEPLFWMGAVYVLVRIVRTGDSRLWIAFGALVGLGLENKHSTVFFGVAVAVAVLATPLRRELAQALDLSRGRGRRCSSSCRT